ncbi:MAG: hypothetical protein EA406_00790, partial [Rhodospirillales bacterium]
KPLPGLRLKGQDLKAALDQEARALPSLTLPAEPAAGRTREARSMSFPTYVWQWLRQQSKLHDEPQNVIVLKALKDAGCPIPDHHLIDGRLKKPRGRAT